MGYPIPAAEHVVEERIKRSRFIAQVAHADSEAAAQAFIARVRARYPDAAHHPWAWQLGPPGDTARVRASDDGEPAGTAGRPMLGVLVAAPVGEVVAVVTRYFGGVKLGAGGLVRAYAGVLAQAMASVPVSHKARWLEVQLTLDWALVPALYHAVPTWQARVVGEASGVRAVLVLMVPEPELDSLARWVREISRGQGKMEIVGRTDGIV